MRGHVETPQDLADRMVRRLFRDRPPNSGDRILYPGCGTGPFPAAVERVCYEGEWTLPTGIGVELNSALLVEAQERNLSHVSFVEKDFLAADFLETGLFDYVIGNPPYVSIEHLDEEEKNRFKSSFTTAVGRFDLYFLFFERALKLLRSGGRLSFITPEKWTYVESAADLRRLLVSEEYHVEEIEHVDEDAFGQLITYPCITTVRRASRDTTRIIHRDGDSHTTMLPHDSGSWASVIRGGEFANMDTGITLGDISIRISAGVATGRDHLFVFSRDDVPSELDPEWVYPTVSGEELKINDSVRSDSVFVCPYRPDGALPDENELSAYGRWARAHREILERRYCVENGGKKWYSWHETPPMEDVLRPKILFRDMADEPKFWVDRDGGIIPRHSVYYLVPKRDVALSDLAEYLNSPEAKKWMDGHCQRAAKGYLRLQSGVLKDLPVPKSLAGSYQKTLAV